MDLGAKSPIWRTLLAIRSPFLSQNDSSLRWKLCKKCWWYFEWFKFVNFVMCLQLCLYTSWKVSKRLSFVKTAFCAQMTDTIDILHLDKIVYGESNREKTVALFMDNRGQRLWISFCPNFSVDFPFVSVLENTLGDETSRQSLGNHFD